VDFLRFYRWLTEIEARAAYPVWPKREGRAGH
jgi:hypothetical protein